MNDFKISSKEINIEFVVEHLLSNLNPNSVGNKIIKYKIILGDNQIKEVIEKYNFEYKLWHLEKIRSEIFYKYASKFTESESFIFIGDKKLESNGKQIYIDVYMRKYKNLDKFDFVFHDVSQVREARNAEFKYRTVFLSKIAHEFKNPLICTTELVNQLSDPLFPEHEKEGILNQIKSLSNYLLVLVKDLNHFTTQQIGKEVSLQIMPVKLNDILKFCQDVGLGLIKKLGKTTLNLKVVNDVIEKMLLLDEWKIKQIILNLISNAIKFSFKGTILLKVENKWDFSKNKNLIIFLIEDQGIGIKEENKKKLFKPFCMETMNQNDLGSGLGLYIINDMCKNFDWKISCESEYQKGSKFIFSLPYDPCPQEHDIL